MPHNGKEVDAQPRVQVTNLAMAGAVVNGAVADGMNALRVKFMQQAAADARDHSFIKGSIVVLVGWEIIKSVSATDALIVVTNVRIETKTSDVIGNPVSVRCPLPVGQPAFDKMKKQNTIRKQEQNLLGRGYALAQGEDPQAHGAARAPRACWSRGSAASWGRRACRRTGRRQRGHCRACGHCGRTHGPD